MRSCLSLAEMCQAQRVSLVLERQVVLVVGPHAPLEGRWEVLDLLSPQPGRYLEATSYDAARRVHRILGADARRAIDPVIGRWRYNSMFPLGSSLEWEALPLETWRPAQLDWGLGAPALLPAPRTRQQRRA